MKLGGFLKKFKNPAVLMGVMMGAQAVAEACKKALSDGKLTLGETIDIVKKTAEVTELSDVVIWQKEEK
jgi:hypothetical protein